MKARWLIVLVSVLPLAAAAQASRLTEAMGSGNASILLEAKRVEVGRMRIIGAAKAEAQRFEGPALLAGYPVKGALRVLSTEDARALGELVLDDRSYTVGEVQRCANDTLIGARFSMGDAKVELALGRPCAQGFVVFHTEGGITTDGGRMTEEAVAAIVRIIDPKP